MDVQMVSLWRPAHRWRCFVYTFFVVGINMTCSRTLVYYCRFELMYCGKRNNSSHLKQVHKSSVWRKDSNWLCFKVEDATAAALVCHQFLFTQVLVSDTKQCLEVG